MCSHSIVAKITCTVQFDLFLITGLSSPRASLATTSQKVGSPEIGPYSWLRPLLKSISSAFGKKKTIQY